MYKQIYLGKTDLLVYFLRFMSTNKVASKPQASEIIHNFNERENSSDTNFINSNHI